MGRPHIALLMFVLSLIVTTTVSAEQYFTATITGTQEVPPNASAARGFATFVLNDALTALTYNATIFGLDFTGSQTPAVGDNLVAAHIHAPAPPGSNAGVVFGFFGLPFNENNPNDRVFTAFATGVGGTVSGKWDTPEGNGTTLSAQLPNILAGLAYINFHTPAFPGGEIRGQIIPSPEPASITLFLIGGAGFAARRFLRRRA